MDFRKDAPFWAAGAGTLVALYVMGQGLYDLYNFKCRHPEELRVYEGRVIAPKVSPPLYEFTLETSEGNRVFRAHSCPNDKPPLDAIIQSGCTVRIEMVRPRGVTESGYIASEEIKEIKPN